MKKYVTVTNGLRNSQAALDVIRSALKTHIPSPDAKWITLKKINDAKFRSFPTEIQASLLLLHYSGKKKLDKESMATGEHARNVAERIMAPSFTISFLKYYY